MTAPSRGQRRAVILLLLLSVVLVTLDHRGDAFRGARGAAHSVVDPAQDGVTTLVAPVGRFFGGLGDVADSGRKIDALQRENAELRRQLRESELSATRSDELQKLKLLSGQGRFTVMPATVTGLGPSIGFEWTVTVDAVKTTLDKCPPELAGDIMDRGIVLAGGGANLRGLDERLRHETGMPILVADNPLHSVAIGSGRCVEDFDALQQVLVSERKRSWS